MRRNQSITVGVIYFGGEESDPSPVARREKQLEEIQG